MSDRNTIAMPAGIIPGYDPHATAGDCQFDESASQRAVDFFHECLTFTAGEWRGQPFVLQPWQESIVRHLFGWKRPDGRRRYREAFIYVPRKNGKALALDTPIPTPNGFTTMGDIAIGDVVFDDNGLPIGVTHVSPVMHDHACLRVSFSDGTAIVADADHLWTVYDRVRGRFLTLRTRDMADSIRCGRAGRRHRYSIPVCGALHTSTRTLPVDPYALGIWLGGADTATGGIAAHFDDADCYVESMRMAGYALRSCADDEAGGTCTRLVFDGLLADLHAAGLVNDRHIPPAYLRASIEQRLALLQGLMDAGGCCSGTGRLAFTAADRRLFEGFLELVRSLEMKPAYESGVTGKKDRFQWRVRFAPHPEFDIFRVVRKAVRMIRRRGKPVRRQSRQIVAVEPAGSEPVRCIAVDSPSRLYLAGEGMIATHNSELAGGLGNLLVFADNEPGAQVYCAAADREQARLVFNAAKTMVLAEPEMAARAKVYTHAIVYEAGGCVLKVISAEAYSKHGINAHGIIVDELHAQPNRDLVDVLTTSTGARRQPLIVHITTADFDRESICNEKYDYARKVRDGVIDDPAFLPVIYEATIDDDWTDPDVWRRVNPNLSVSVSVEYLERECRKARDTPSYENTFKRLHLNIRTQQDIRWLSLEAWDACDGARIDESALEKKLCFAGLDLSTTTDLSALVLAFPHDDGTVTLLPRFWVPADNAEKRERRDRVPYQTWARQGFIEMTPGNVIDYDRIKARIDELDKRFDIREIAVDRWNATHLITQLTDEGYRVVPFGQGYKDMTAPTKELEKLVISAKLRHGGHPVLRWMASHVSVETDAAGNLKPSKKKSTDRIDGLVAAIMALGRLLYHNQNWQPGVKILWVD